MMGGGGRFASSLTNGMEFVGKKPDHKVSPVSYKLGQALIKVDHIGIVNIIAGERIVPG